MHIEEFLNETFIKEINSTLELFPEYYRKLIEDLVYSRLEIENLKIAISNSRSDIKLDPKFKVNYLLDEGKYEMIKGLNSFDEFLKMIDGISYYSMPDNMNKLSS